MPFFKVDSKSRSISLTSGSDFLGLGGSNKNVPLSGSLPISPTLFFFFFVHGAVSYLGLPMQA